MLIKIKLAVISNKTNALGDILPTIRLAYAEVTQPILVTMK